MTLIQRNIVKRCTKIVKIKRVEKSFNLFINFIDCSTVFQGLLNLGFSSVIMNGISYIRKMHERFKIEMKNGSTFAENNRQSLEIVKISKKKQALLVNIRRYAV